MAWVVAMQDVLAVYDAEGIDQLQTQRRGVGGLHGPATLAVIIEVAVLDVFGQQHGVGLAGHLAQQVVHRGDLVDGDQLQRVATGLPLAQPGLPAQARAEASEQGEPTDLVALGHPPEHTRVRRVGMSAEFYKVVHILGIAFVMMGLGGAWMAQAKAKVPAMLHGIGLLAILVSGFGMVAKYDYDLGGSGWIHAKLGLWVLLGALIAIARKLPKAQALVFVGGPLLVALSAYIALYKPF